MKIPTQSLGLTGYVIASVMNADGSIAREYPLVRNLWLDQGLDRLSTVLIADAFDVCAKGTSQDATLESPSGTYTLSGGTVHRVSGSRDFTADDRHKLIRSANGKEALISAYTDATHVDVVGVGLASLVNFTTQAIDIYSVQLTKLTNEAFCTFSTETITKVDANATVTATGAAFASTDVGRAIFVGGTSGDPYAERYSVATYISATQITVDRTAGEFTGRRLIIYTPQPGDIALTPISRTSVTSSVTGENGKTDNLTTGERTLTRTFVFAPEPEYIEYRSSDDSGTFTWSSTSVTRTAGARNFTNADVGKYLKFSTNEFCKITARSSNTVVTVDRSPAVTITNGTVTALYGGRSYDGILFSDSDNPDTNANIIVRLEDVSGNSDPVFILGPNPEFPGQQLKVTYICKATVGPIVATGRAVAGISDPANVMSSNKFGTSVVEAIALSSIADSGETLTDFDVLEPAVAGAVALSPSFVALDPLSGPDRGAGSQSVSMEAAGYTNGDFSKLYEGTFGINDAIATNWRTLGIFDVNSLAFAFTWLFESAQIKTGEVIIVIRFRKSWNRNLA